MSDDAVIIARRLQEVEATLTQAINSLAVKIVDLDRKLERKLDEILEKE